MPRHLQIMFALLLVVLFALGFYGLELKRRAEESALRGDGRPLTAPVAGNTEPVSLYIAYDEDGVLRKRQASAALPADTAGRAREVLRTLLAQYQQKSSPHPLAPEADVRDVFIVNRSLAVIDFNSDFATRHRSGILVEALTMDSIVATLGANLPEVREVKFLVDGKERETLAGHADLMGLYDVNEVNRIVQDMQ